MRLAAPPDHPIIARLFPELVVPDPTPSPELYETRMLPNVIIAEEKGDACGYCFWQVFQSYVHVSHVITDPRFRNRGVGRAMLDDVRTRMRSLGMKRWSLNVKKDNAPAIALYRRCGFAIDHEAKTLRTSWSALPKGASRARAADASEDALLAEKYGIDPGRFATWRTRGSVVFAIREGSEIVAFGVFDPHHLGFSRFEIARADLALPLLEAARPHAKSEEVGFFLENALAIDTLSKMGVPTLMEVYHMAGSINESM